MFNWISNFIDSAQDWIISWIPTGAAEQLHTILANVPPSVKYMFYLTGMDVALPATITAFAIAFIIRRFPIIG